MCKAALALSPAHDRPERCRAGLLAFIAPSRLPKLLADLVFGAVHQSRDVGAGA
jgi:hypothetical protein